MHFLTFKNPTNKYLKLLSRKLFLHTYEVLKQLSFYIYNILKLKHFQED